MRGRRNFFFYLQATDIHSEFMKAIDACHVKYQEDKVWWLVELWMNLTCVLSGRAGGHLQGRELTEEGGHVAGHALQEHQPEAGAPQEVGQEGHLVFC